MATTDLFSLIILDTHGLDHCTRGEGIRKIANMGFWAPKSQNLVDATLSKCKICIKNNTRKGVTTPIGHIPILKDPFTHITMDYVDMIKPIQGKRYMLVIEDRLGRSNPSKTPKRRHSSKIPV